MLSDCHAHLDAWPENERSGVIKAAQEEGVELVIAAAMSLESSQEVAWIATTYAQIVYAAVGIHPWNPVSWNRELYQALKDLARRPEVVAVSEVGLDANRGDRELQKELLRGEIQLALELGLPLILHCREAHDEMMALLRGAPGVRGAIHGFSGTAAQLQDWLALGFFVSMGRGLLRPEAWQWEAVVPQIPDDRLLLETDAARGPSISGEAPGPAGVKAVAQRVAQLRGVAAAAIGQTATTNLKRLLGLGS